MKVNDLVLGSVARRVLGPSDAPAHPIERIRATPHSSAPKGAFRSPPDSRHLRRALTND